MKKFLQRLYLHTYRHRVVVVISTLLLFSFVVLFGLLYPGEEGIEGFLSAFALVASLEFENPGYYVWLIFTNTMAIGIYISLIGIFLGVNVLPISDKDGKELIFTTPKSVFWNLFENLTTATLLLALILVPTYVTQVIFSIINDATDVIEGLTIGMVLIFILGTLMIFITAFGSALRYSKGTGYAIGGLYFIFSFIADLTANSSPDYEVIKDFSLYSRAKMIESSFNVDWNTDFILLAGILIIILFILSWIILMRKDFLEGGHKSSEELVVTKEMKKRRLNLAIIKKPIDKVLSSLGWRFPVIRDQLHSSTGIFIIYLLFSLYYVSYVISMFPGEEDLSTLLGGFDLPIIRAFLFGYSLESTTMGYIAMEIFSFSWLIFGFFPLIVINDIVMRDKKNRYSEITWSFPKNASRIILERTIAGLVYFLIILVFTVVLFIPLQSSVGMNIDMSNILAASIVLIWGNCIFFIFFLAVALIAPYKHFQKTLILSYAACSFILLIAFVGNFEWLRFLTPFGYFNVVGVFLEKVTFQQVLPEIFICTILTMTLLWLILHQRIAKTDYLV